MKGQFNFYMHTPNYDSHNFSKFETIPKH